MINIDEIRNSAVSWKEALPFSHLIIDDFFDKDIALNLENEFPNYDSSIWHEYGNAIEIKKTCNNWNVFPKLTYSVFAYLNSDGFINELSKILFEASILSSDPGLNGGGWHIHKQGGKLNTHLDYSLHPKLALQRKLNIIVYLNSEWQSEWGGHLGLWNNESDKEPGELCKEIEPKFNRAIIFDTTQNSWHGLPNPLTCPENQFRKSIAVYYLTEPPENIDKRGKAFFAPSESQKNDKAVLDLIKKRSDVKDSSSVYRNKD